ncbi:MAG TPA: ABC transporter ATP-binding protein [Patescibacteria group bacterium]|nr:ABC transporter ATP-binding protein [Patescibacteria group bacterium]
MDKTIPKNPFAFGIYLSKIHKKYSVSALIFVFIASALSRSSVIVLQFLTNAVTAHPVIATYVWLWAIVYPSIFFFAECVWRCSGFTGMRWFTSLRFSAFSILYEYLSLHSKEYFSNRFAGSLASKISNAVDGTEQLFENILWNFLPLGLGICWYIIFTLTSNVWLGIIIICWSAIFFGANVFFARILQPKSFHNAESISVLKGRITDSLSNISLVHEYAHVAGERSYIGKYANKERLAGLALWNLGEWILFANSALLFLFVLVMLSTAIYLFLHAIVTIGVVVMVIGITADLTGQLLFLGQQITDSVRLYGQIKEGLTEIIQKHDIIDTSDAVQLHATKGSIDMKDITFEYENVSVFSNFSLSIIGGQKVGLVGKSGAGKSTFVSLLLRHYDVQKGEIAIDGQNIHKATLESLRRSIAFVPQDTGLFHRSIKENISYGNPNATDQQVETAAKLAQADEFIKKLPEGYQTLVGERGVKLSGGQRQRVAIARAFLKNAPILILDEATSSLDSESEHAIQESLEKLMEGRTVIAIAHRLSTLKEMDRIVVIANGKIIEDGNPEALLKKQNGVFKKMWDHQVKGFIVDE